MLFASCEKPELDESDSENNSSLFAELESTYDLNIHYLYSESFFPDSWLAPPINAYGVEIEYSEAERMVKIIDDCLSQYSDIFLSSNLEDIFLLKRLYFYDMSFGGTSSNTGIYITNDRYSNEFLLARLHSEFSSILYRNYSSLFPFEEWNRINSSEFEYVGSGVDLLGQDDLYGQTEELLINGFLVKYSASSMENDFNMIVDWIFTKPNELHELIQNYDKIREKYNLVIRFYSQINSGVDFTSVG